MSAKGFSTTHFDSFTEYPYLSASFYEKGIKRYEKLLHDSEVW